MTAEDLKGVTLNPGVGDYNVEKSFSFIQSRNPGWTMGRERLIKFTEQAASQKQLLPGIGQYKTENFLKTLTRPYTRKYWMRFYKALAMAIEMCIFQEQQKY